MPATIEELLRGTRKVTMQELQAGATTPPPPLDLNTQAKEWQEILELNYPSIHRDHVKMRQIRLEAENEVGYSGKVYPGHIDWNNLVHRNMTWELQRRSDKLKENPKIRAFNKIVDRLSREINTDIKENPHSSLQSAMTRSGIAKSPLLERFFKYLYLMTRIRRAIKRDTFAKDFADKELPGGGRLPEATLEDAKLLAVFEEVEKNFHGRFRGTPRAKIMEDLPEGELDPVASSMRRRLAVDYFNSLDPVGEGEKRAKQMAKLARMKEDLPDSAWLRDPIVIFAGFLNDMGSMVARPFDDATADEINQTTDVMIQAAEAISEEVSYFPRGHRWLTTAGRSLATSVTVGLITHNPYAIIGVFSAQEMNQAITEGREIGLSGGELTDYVIKQGVIEAAFATAFQQLGIGGMESLMAGSTKEMVKQGWQGAFKTFLKTAAQEVPEEILTEISHSIVRAAAKNSILTMSELNDVMLDTTAATLLGVTGGTIFRAHGINRYVKAQVAQRMQIKTDLAGRVASALFAKEYQDEINEAIMEVDEEADVEKGEGVENLVRVILEQREELDLADETIQGTPSEQAAVDQFLAARELDMRRIARDLKIGRGKETFEETKAREKDERVFVKRKKELETLMKEEIPEGEVKRPTPLEINIPETVDPAIASQFEQLFRATLKQKGIVATAKDKETARGPLRDSMRELKKFVEEHNLESQRKEIDIDLSDQRAIRTEAFKARKEERAPRGVADILAEQKAKRDAKALKQKEKDEKKKEREKKRVEKKVSKKKPAKKKKVQPVEEGIPPELQSLPDAPPIGYRSVQEFELAKGATANDVVVFELETLKGVSGIKLSSTQRNALKSLPANRVIWVTETKEQALEIYNLEGGVREVDTSGGKIVLDFGDVGLLILLPKPEPGRKFVGKVIEDRTIDKNDTLTDVVDTFNQDEEGSIRPLDVSSFLRRLMHSIGEGFLDSHLSWMNRKGETRQIRNPFGSLFAVKRTKNRWDISLLPNAKELIDDSQYDLSAEILLLATAPRGEAQFLLETEVVEGLPGELGSTFQQLGEYIDDRLTDKQKALLPIAWKKPKPIDAEDFGTKSYNDALRDWSNARQQLISEGFVDVLAILDATTQLADLVFSRLQAAAGMDISYFEDYFYGFYENSKDLRKWLETKKDSTEVRRFTDRFLKEKKIPSPAIAANLPGISLKLIDKNPIWNIKRELEAINGYYQQVHLRDQMITLGAAVLSSEAGVELAANWKHLPHGSQNIWGDYIIEPSAASLIIRMIKKNAFNKGTLKAIRGTAALHREANFLLNLFFHPRSILTGRFAATRLRDFVSPEGLKAILKDLSTGKLDPANMAFDRKRVYGVYRKHQGAEMSAMEHEGQLIVTQMLKFLKKVPVANIPAAVYRETFHHWQQWMFNEYIPMLKFTRFYAEYKILEQRLAAKEHREPSTSEIQDIIRAIQNIFGEMNEKLLGWSGSITSFTRVLFRTPGYFMGTFFTVKDALFAWTGEKGRIRGRIARRAAVQGLVFMGILAQVANLILTGKTSIPDDPENFKDIFRIYTGRYYEGEEIVLDPLTQESDVWELVFKPAIMQITQGTGPEQFFGHMHKRLGTMVGIVPRWFADTVTVLTGRGLYDYKNDLVVKMSDPWMIRLQQFLLHELGNLTPISISQTRSILNKGFTAGESILYGMLGVKLTFTEESKRRGKFLQLIGELKDTRHELLVQFSRGDATVEDFKDLNEKVKSIKSLPGMTPNIARVLEIDKIEIDLEDVSYYKSLYLLELLETNRLYPNPITTKRIARTKKFLVAADYDTALKIHFLIRQGKITQKIRRSFKVSIHLTQKQVSFLLSELMKGPSK